MGLRLPPRSLWGGTGGSGGIFSLRKKPLPFLVSIPCALLRAGFVLLREAGPASASCISAETGTWSRWGPPSRGPTAHPLEPSPGARAGHASPSLGGFAGGQGPACWAASVRVGQLGHAPKLLSSREIIVLLKEWDKQRASPWKPWRSEAPSSAASSSVISSNAYTGMGLEPLPLSFRLRSCCCETPTALPDGSEGRTRA